MNEFVIYLILGIAAALLLLRLIDRLTEEPAQKAPEHYCIGCDKLEFIHGNITECKISIEPMEDVRYCCYHSKEVRDDGI